MYFKNFIGAVLIGLIFFANVAEAYDLPKATVEKKISQQAEQTDKKNIFKSDWTKAELFKEKIQAELKKNKRLPADDKRRILQDKNLIFVAIYKGDIYFLDRYSIEVKKSSAEVKSWKQKIFTIGKDISAQKAQAVNQTFYVDKTGKYNSSRRKNKLDDVENLEDKEFLQECYEVGFNYAFPS